MILLKLNESSASLRVVPLPPLLQGSATTSAATNESGRTFYFAIGGVDYGSGGSLSVISANMGLYQACFSASKISVTGPGFVYYGLPNSSLTALQVAAPFMIVPVDSYDSMRFGLFALPNVAAEAAGGLVTNGTGTGQLSVSNGSVGLKAQTHSQATVGGADNLGRREYSDLTLRIGLVDYSGATLGINNIKAAVYSGVSVEVKTGGIQATSVGVGSYSGVSVEVKTGGIQTTSIGAGNYSGVSLEVKSGGIQVASVGAGSYSGVSVEVKTGGIQTTSVGAGTYSSVTVQGVTRVNSSVTIADGLYSAVTTRLDLVAYSGATVGAGNIAPNVYSGVSVEVKAGGIQAGSLGAGTITAAKFAASAIDAAALATDAGQEIADALLARNIAGGSSTGRIVSEALYPLRNKSTIENSVGTVFGVDDTTSAWTFGVTSLGTAPIASIDPGGP